MAKPERILVVEDSPTQAERLRCLLEEAGFEVDVARNGVEGFDRCRAAPYDLVLTDVIMPKVDGYELCSRIKADPALRSLKVVLLTTLGEPSDIIRGLECGADNFVTKPYEAEALLGRIRTFLATPRTGERVRVASSLAFMGRQVEVTSDLGQVLDFLVSTFGEFTRTQERELERKLADETRRLEEVTRRFFTLSLDLMCILGFDGYFKRLNPAWERTLGFTVEELLARPFIEFVHPDDRAGTLAGAAGIAAGADLKAFENRYLCKDGSVRWLLWSAVSFEAEHSLYAVGHDITERKEAEAQVERHARRQEAVASIGQSVLAGLGVGALMDEAAPIVARALDVEYSLIRELTADGRRFVFRAGTGWAREQEATEVGSESGAGYALLSAGPVVVEDLQVETRFKPSRFLKGHGVVSCMKAIIRSGSRPFGLIGVYTARRRTFAPDEVHFLQAIANILATAVERTRVESALRESEGRFRRLLESNVVGISIGNTDGQVVEGNDAYLAMVRRTRTDLEAGRISWSAMVAPEFKGEADRIARDLRDTGVAAPRAIEYLLAGGLRVPMLIAIARLDGAHGHSLVVTLDMTDRKRLDAALREERDFTAAIVDTVGALVIVLDASGRVVRFNRACEAVSGRRAAEVVGRTLWEVEILQPEDIAAERCILERSCAGELPGKRETRWLDKEGRRRLITWSSATLAGTGGGPPYVIGTGVDLTDQRALEEQLRQAQKMEAVGRLAGGIAHDFNNLLTAITGYSELILAGMRAEDPIRPDLEEIRKAGFRAAALTRQLLAFSRKQVLAPMILDLNNVVKNTEKLLLRLLGEDVALASIFGPALGTILADAGQIEQVIVNLAVNARDAMPGGGKLTIETANLDLDEVPPLKTELKPGPYVLLSVSDSGTGMDPEVRAHLFEPFFTTKEQGKGTGLGLSTVYGIVKQSGGHIAVYSEPGQGTTFKIFFPRLDAAAHVAPAGEEVVITRGTETVLIVEDEAIVRSFTRRSLEMLGYVILEAGDGEAALALAEGYAEPIHLLVTDVIMPKMNGSELARRLAAQRPALRVLYVSGYTSGAISRHGVLEPGVAFLEKPFAAAALARKAREVLGAPAASAQRVEA